MVNTNKGVRNTQSKPNFTNNLSDWRVESVKFRPSGLPPKRCALPGEVKKI